MQGFIRDKCMLVLYDEDGLRGIYENDEDLLNYLKEEFDNPNLTIEDLIDDCFRIERVPLYKSKETIRDEKINTILK